MKEKFDDRTLAGFHIVHQHMLSSIGTEAEEKEVDYSHHEYYVDSNDILRKSAYKSYYYRAPREPFSDKQKDMMLRWLEGRAVGFINGVLHWFHVKEECTVSWDSHCGIRFSRWDVSWTARHHVNFVIGTRCTAGDVNFFRSLPGWVREKLLEIDPEQEAQEEKDQDAA